MKLETFFEHFDLLAEAPNGVQKLRELILDLAVRGKLVTQDANDEPAAVLLERIKKEKERLVKEGKISKLELLPPIKHNDILYNLPSTWLWVRLGEVVDYNGAAKVSPSEIPEDSWLLELEDIEKDSSKIIQRCTFKERNSKSTKARFLKGDVLYGKLRPYLNKVVIADADGFCTTEIIPLRSYLGIFSKYLMYALKRRDFIEYVNAKTYGVKMPRLGTDDGRRALLPLPPLEEQKRIVTKVDELMKLCDELEARQKKKRETRILINNAALNKLLTADTPETFTKNWQCIGDNFDILYSAPENIGKLRQAILQLAVMGKLVPQDANDEPAAVLLERIKKEKERLVKEGKIKKEKFLPAIKDDEIPFELPIGWEWVRVIDIVDIGTGSTPATTNPEYYGGNIPWYTSSATNNYIAEKPQVFITEKALKETNCKIFPSGSLIIALYGQGKTRGQISEIMIAGATNQAIAAMVFFESSKELKKYIKYYFLKIYDEIRNLAEGGAQPNLNVGKIKNTLIPIPPFNEQKRIVTKVDKLMKLCDELETKLTQTQTESEKIINAAVKQLLTV
jgi:type I restriction enzyme S subunit